MSEDRNGISQTHLYILRAISSGNRTAKQIAFALHLDEGHARHELDLLSDLGFVRYGGILRGTYALTPDAISILADNGYLQENIPNIAKKPGTQKSEVRHTTTVRASFSLTFGAILGAAAAFLTIGVIASVAYFVGYHFVLKDVIPKELLPIIPMDNFVVDLVLGLLTSLAVFMPFRTRMNPFGFLGGR
jgi:hypothetical protein